MPRSLLFASALLFLPVAPALAQPDEVRSQVVSYADLDLSSAPDADRMIHRIHRAARNVCSDDTSPPFLSDAREAHACAKDAEQRGVADTGSPVVTARYYGRTPQVIVGDSDDTPPPAYYEK